MILLHDVKADDPIRLFLHATCALARTAAARFRVRGLIEGLCTYLVVLRLTLCTGEAYVKALLNPFHELNAPIKSPAFDARVREAAKKHL